MTRVFPLILVAVLLAGFAVPGEAQEAEDDETAPPLTKSELTRLLASATYTADELVDIIGRNCLSFEPTDRDVRDFRRLGAATRVLATIEECRGRSAPLTAALESRILSARVGESVMLAAEVERGGEPQPGVRLILRGTSQIRDGPGRDLTATTTQEGEALFRIPAGSTPGQYELDLGAVEGELQGDLDIVFEIRAGPPAYAEITPGRLRVVPGRDETEQVTAVAWDRFGNRVPGVPLTLRPEPAGSGEEIPTRTTDSRGEVVFDLATGPLENATSLAVMNREETLERLPVNSSDAPERISEDALSGEPVAGEGTGGEENGADTEGRLERAFTLLGGGEPEDAESLFREVLQEDPSHTEATMGLALATLRQGRAEEAVEWYESAAEESPEDVNAWLGLGRARAEAGRVAEARDAFERVLELEPGHSEARQELASLQSVPQWLELSLWGGDTFENAGAAGFRAAAVRLRATPDLQLRGRFDRGLYLHDPALVRGRGDIEGYYVGAALDWGEEGEHTSTLELGRRDQGMGLVQNLVRAEHEVRFTVNESRIRWNAGGIMGRWFDRDDWLLYTRAEIPVLDEMVLKPSVHTGETVGSPLFGAGEGFDRRGREFERLAGTETRAYLALEYRLEGDWRVEPAFGYGNVDGDSDEFTGGLWDGSVRASAPLGDTAGRAQLFLRHQRPPGMEAFTVLAAGVVLGMY